VPRLAKGEAATVPRRKGSRVAEFEESAAMPEAERMGLEVRNMPELESKTPAIAEPTLVAEVTEMPRLEVWDMSELKYEAFVVAEFEHEAPVAEVTEGQRLEVAVLPEEAAMVELKAKMRPMKSCAGVRREMAETEGAVTRLGGLRYHPYRGHYGCKDQDLAHHVAP
jgi:hypothetical protein